MKGREIRGTIAVKRYNKDCYLAGYTRGKFPTSDSTRALKNFKESINKAYK